MRPKISRIDFDVTERENSEVWSGPPEPAVEFHAGFEERTALDEQAILHELSDELREDVMQFLLPGPFRECYLFERQNSAIVLRFADSIQPVASHAGEVVQTTGDTGDLMYVLASGTAAATRDFTGPGDSGLLAGADDAEKAPKKRHSLKRQQSQVSKSKKRMSAKLNGLDPQAYLADILDRIHDHKINRLDELLPWNWAPLNAAHSESA